jgi:hypothetical protein
MPLISSTISGGATGVSTSLSYSGGKFAGATVTHVHAATGQSFTFQFGGGSSVSGAPSPTPITPTFDPKIEANALYGKPMALSALGYARIGGSPAPIVGPYLTETTVDFIVSFGVPANVEGDRKIYKIYLDNELAWSSASGGTLPGDGTFAAEAFDFIFKPGRLDQTVCSLETEKFAGDECAYRPQMILEIRNLIFARFMERTGKPVPYVALDIGDVTDGADPADGINLGEALERVAFSPWAGYSPSTFESVGVTDVVDAILIKDNFTVVQLCQSVTREYRNIDLLVSDKTRVKDRGSSVTPSFVFNRNTIISDDEAIVVSRTGATEQRREHELIAIDPDQDYTAVPSLSKIPRNPMVISAAVGKETVTVPLVIDADTRQALATFSQQYEENARRKVAFKVRAAGYPIEPGDLFALTDIAEGIDNEVFKCIQTTHGANWIVEVEGEAILRCSIFQETVPGTAVVASGDHDGGIRYCYVEGTAPQDWHGRSSNTDGVGWPFATGSIVASSYAKVGGMPTFLMGGNDSVFILGGHAVMMISHDAINWTHVYEGATTNTAVYNIVWDAAEGGAFYADIEGPVANGIAVPSPTASCLRSATGYAWEVVADNFWTHTQDGKTPDGRAGHDPESGLTIRPEDLSLGVDISCTAYANGIWMAGGGEAGASITMCSFDGGVNWSVATSGGGVLEDVLNARIRTIVAAPMSDISG